MPVSPDPGWANFDNADFTASGKNRGAFFRDHQKIVFEDFLNNGLRERLTLFWSNHFVTEYYMYITLHIHSDIIIIYKNMH